MINVSVLAALFAGMVMGFFAAIIAFGIGMMIMNKERKNDEHMDR